MDFSTFSDSLIVCNASLQEKNWKKPARAWANPVTLPALLPHGCMQRATIVERTRRRGAFTTCALLLLILLLPACQSTETRRFGGVLGSVAGSIGGSYMGGYLGGGTAGRILGAVAGGVAGYYVGDELGRHLGQDDKRRMAEASRDAFDTGQTQTFSNPDRGLHGKAEVVSSSQGETQQNECKTIRQTVVLEDGKTMTEDIKSCRQAD